MSMKLVILHKKILNLSGYSKEDAIWKTKA